MKAEVFLYESVNKKLYSLRHYHLNMSLISHWCSETAIRSQRAFYERFKVLYLCTGIGFTLFFGQTS